ncbi:very short patch repair endonuclease [Rhizobium laguerreae]|uniref:very short patch repair endonuclease n=1 Tax=Rhizobium laguerreae TaxID=1076926 RepID=UPI0013D716E3|nr:very short patch repair endonuclease [Rhizobium laguerreae]
MTDTVSTQTRSRMMSAVRNRDTQPELLVRRNLHKAGIRYRLHDRNLPGRPDLVLPKYRAVFFINGCFWHGHDCPRFSWPKTREAFWINKILGNKNRDTRNHMELRSAGWRVAVVWGCALKGKGSLGIDAVSTECIRWLNSSEPTLSIVGPGAEIVCK